MDEEGFKKTCIREKKTRGDIHQPFYGTWVADFMLREDAERFMIVKVSATAHTVKVITVYKCPHLIAPFTQWAACSPHLLLSDSSKPAPYFRGKSKMYFTSISLSTQWGPKAHTLFQCLLSGGP